MLKQTALGWSDTGLEHYKRMAVSLARAVNLESRVTKRLSPTRLDDWMPRQSQGVQYPAKYKNKLQGNWPAPTHRDGG